MAKKYSRKLNFNASAKLEEKVKVAEPLYWLIVVMLITLSIVLVAITVPRPFGFVTAGEEKTYVQNLNIELNETTVYEWTLSVAEEQAQLTALAVSGSVIGNGKVF